MATRLGCNLQQWRGGILDGVIASKAAVLKPIDTFDRSNIRTYVDTVRGWVFPRVYVDDIPINTASNMAQLVADRVSRQLDPIKDLVDATFFLNESQETFPEQVKWLNEATVIYEGIMHSRGYEVIIGSFGVGNPANPGDIALMADAIRGCFAIDYHGYGAPRIWDPNPRDYVLRYRDMRAILEAQKDSTLLRPWVIGEVGIDGELINQSYKGWKTYVSAQEYLNELQWFDAEMAKDTYVIGACIFGLGMEAIWNDYDIEGQTQISSWLGSQGNPVKEYPMSLADQFPQQYKDWVAAGGIESNFADHLVGIGVLPPSLKALVNLANNMNAKAQQIKNVATALGGSP